MALNQNSDAHNELAMALEDQIHDLLDRLSCCEPTSITAASMVLINRCKKIGMPPHETAAFVIAVLAKATGIHHVHLTKGALDVNTKDPNLHRVVPVAKGQA